MKSWYSLETSSKLDNSIPMEVNPAKQVELLNQNYEIKRPSALKSIRYYVMIIGLVCVLVTAYSKTIINFAIIDMIDPEFIAIKNAEVDLNSSTNETAPYFDLDNSCPVADRHERIRLLKDVENDTRRARKGSGDKFKWDTFKQGLLKGAYSMGMLFQIPGSRLSEIYGAHRVLSAGALLITTSCLLAPYLAAVNFYLLLGDLILLGIWGSFTGPAVITLSANWLTPGEKSIMVSFHMVASRLGYALSSILCGLLIEAQYSWRYAFYSAGWVSLASGTFAFMATRSRPVDHPLIRQSELEYLAIENTLVRESLDHRREPTKPVDREEMKTKTGAPWVAILTNIPVIAFIVTKFCLKLTLDTVEIELPSYLKRVMHLPPKSNGLINSLNYVIFCSGCLGIGALSTKLTQVRPFNLSKTALRKIFQSISSFGATFALLGLAFGVCDENSTQIFLILMFLTITFVIGGEAQGPMDLTERYCGTVHAIANSLAISGIVEPTLVGYLMRGQPNDRDSWKCLWLGASVVASLGGLVFLMFGDAKVQPFDDLHEKMGDKTGEHASREISDHFQAKETERP